MIKRTASSNQSMLPPTYFLIAMVLMVALHLILPIFQWFWWPWRVLGIFLFLSALAVILIGDRQFKRHNTTIKPFQESSALVIDGVFRFSRNPMYLGMVLILVGLALGLGSLTPSAVIPGFVWLITQRFIQIEEDMLVSRFGDEYRRYKTKVRRWL